MPGRPPHGEAGGQAPSRGFRVPAWAWPLLALPVVAGVGIWTYTSVASAMRGRLEESLQTMLTSHVAALGQWLKAEGNTAALIAADPRVRADVAELIELGRRTGGDAEALKAAPAQARLREIVAPVVAQQENAGY